MKNTLEHVTDLQMYPIPKSLILFIGQYRTKDLYEWLLIDVNYAGKSNSAPERGNSRSIRVERRWDRGGLKLT